MDLTLTLINSAIKMKMYQKATNLYLYLPPVSFHPYDYIKGTIYGLVMCTSPPSYLTTSSSATGTQGTSGVGKTLAGYKRGRPLPVLPRIRP